MFFVLFLSLSLKDLFVIMYVCVCMWVFACEFRCTWRCPTWMLRTQLGSSAKAVIALNC